MTLSREFVWGAASSAYQIEGAAYEDGKGRSIWDVFSQQPNAIKNGDTGDVTSDHYHCYQRDLDLMREIGLQGYRFSVSWPRVMPEGTGGLNNLGLDFYDRLVDGLLARQITPFVTLFHWDFPYELYCRGGWLNSDAALWFGEYTQAVVRRLGDRVRHWITLNEPEAFVVLGHWLGCHAPGLKLWYTQVVRIINNVFRAHAMAAQAIRACAPTAPQVGITISTVASMPATDSPEDVAAARQHMFRIADRDLLNTGLWFDPVFLGRHAEGWQESFGSFDESPLDAGAFSQVGQPLDFMGANIYQGKFVRAGADGKPEVLPFPPGKPSSAYDWNVTPEVLYWAPKFLYERYGLPMYITENGIATTDWVYEDGKVHDPQRTDFLQRYLRHLKRACAENVRVDGYFHWALMDNLEWADGYKHRFGLIHVDYASQQRTLKDSAYRYREIIASNGADL